MYRDGLVLAREETKEAVFEISGARPEVGVL